MDKLDDDRYFTGKKGEYCDLVMIPTPSSDYGSWGLVQKSTKEERDSGLKMPFVGNADYAGERQEGSGQQNFAGSQASQRPMAETISTTPSDLAADDIPF